MKKLFLLFFTLLPSLFTLHPSSFSLFAQDVNFDMAMRKLNMATVMTNLYYVDSVSIERQVEDAINGMLSKLDPHSQYSNAKDTKKMNEPLEGSFEGIGVQFNMLEDTLVVIQPVSNGPSEKCVKWPVGEGGHFGWRPHCLGQ